jgi:DNA-binding beta-propeller fold protein YncE
MKNLVFVFAVLLSWSAGDVAAQPAPGDVPRFVVDPYWPKPLPNRWVTGEVGGICVDRQDRIIALNRLNLTPLQKRMGKIPAPPVIVYNASGDIVSTWGNPDVLPKNLHNCFVDHQNNIWIGGTGGGAVQKWSLDGKQMLLQIGDRDKCDGECGEKGSGNKSSTLLNQPSDIFVDPSNDEVYIADGYGNHRIAVFDAKGKFLRQWGSPGTGPGQFAPVGAGHPHCVLIGQDGLVYVCDRGNDRIQVFDKKGGFKLSIPVKLGTGFSQGADGSPPRNQVASANDMDFFGPNQQYLLVTDPGNEQLWILDRASAKGGVPPVVAGFGSQGENAGNFMVLHGLAVDSKGTLYTAEVIDGRRVQKFVPAGTLSAGKLSTYLGSPHYEPFPDAPRR